MAPLLLLLSFGLFGSRLFSRGVIAFFSWSGLRWQSSRCPSHDD